MGAIFRRDGNMVAITPSAAIGAGDVVKIGDRLIGVAISAIPANTTGYVNTAGEYDVALTAGTAYDIGAAVTCAAVTLAGSSTTVEFGPALKAVLSTDTVARCRLVADKPEPESSGTT